jgi:hypothetical protein
MYDQFVGDEWIIRGASMRDFRAIEDGFRHLLQVRPDYQMIAHGSTFDYFLQNLRQSGEYVVEWKDNAPTVRLATPPDLSVDIQFDDTETQTLSQFESTVIQVNIRNRGLQDITNAHIQISVALDENVEILNDDVSDILAGETTRIDTVWSPVVPGVWKIDAKVTQVTQSETASLDQTVTESTTLIEIEDASEIDSLNLLSFFKKLPLNGIFVATLLVTLSILAAVISYYVFQIMGDY